MKKLFLSLGALLAFAAQAQYFQLTRDGVPNPTLRFGTEADCRNAVPKIGLPGVYSCPWNRSIQTKPVGSVPVVAAPVVASLPAANSAPVSTAGLSPACVALYAQKPITSLSEARSIDPLNVGAKPARGSAFVDPVYGTCLTRATDHVADGIPGYIKNEYSRRQAFNSNNTMQLVAGLDGYWHIYDANTHKRVKSLPASASGEMEPQWSATDPDKFMFMNSFGDGMQMKEFTVSTGAVRLVGDLSARIKKLYPGAVSASTGDEGSPSKDGRFWCLMVRDKAENEYQTALADGVIVWDAQNDQIVGSMKLGDEIPDHVSMSPSGDYCVVSSDGPIGTTAFSRDFTKKTKLLNVSQHSDLAIDANGRDVYVAVDYSTNDGEVFMVDLATGARTYLMRNYLDGTSSAFHFSGKAFKKPGWILMDAGADGGDGRAANNPPTARKWFHRKIMAVELKANPRIFNLAFTRSSYTDYGGAVLASVNRDFTRIAFNSNFGTDDLDVYTIEIPGGLLK